MLQHSRTLFWALAILTIACPSFASAQELSLGAPFSPNMVLQRSQPIPIWGRGVPGHIVAVTLTGKTLTTTVQADGNWSVEFQPQAAAEGVALAITHHGQELLLDNLAIGDVFLCSGQSNMERNMASTTIGGGDKNLPIDAKIRILTIPMAQAPLEQTGFKASTAWRIALQNSANFSAVCLLSGREIATNQDVTVGLINASYGGTPIEAWIPYEGIAKLDGMEKQLAVLDAYRRDPVAAEAVHGKVLFDMWEKLPAPGRRLKGREGYANLFNAMVAPLKTTRLAGAIWYQGENNANSNQSTEAYRQMLEAMIVSWRSRFASKMPFAIVQLSNFGKLSGAADNDGWAAVREAQRLVARDDPDTELVVTIDIGERLDIHPPLKKPVGQRAGAALLKLVYGKADAYRPPEALSARRLGDTIEIAVSRASEPLFAASWGRPGPFMLCDDAAGKVCSFADAQFSTIGIAVDVPQGAKPVLVRYCWDAAPICNVFDPSEMPLGPFELAITR